MRDIVIRQHLKQAGDKDEKPLIRVWYEGGRDEGVLDCQAYSVVATICTEACADEESSSTMVAT